MSCFIFLPRFFYSKGGIMKQQNGLELNATGKKILSSEGRSRYDTEAINLIKDKQILAWILQDCVEEFKGMTRAEIIHQDWGTSMTDMTEKTR